MGDTAKVNAVTGAFGFSGRSIAVKLLERGEVVRTLTNHPNPGDPIADKVTVAPLKFDDPAGLRESLKGVSVLYNTYWIRFAHGDLTFDIAIKNSLALVQAAVEAGIEWIVHVSIANPSEDSPLPYYHGKALVEKAIVESGLSYAILRPTVIFGDKGILLNTIAWMLRRSPFFPIPGDGNYKLQPVYVEDLADLAISLGERVESGERKAESSQTPGPPPTERSRDHSDNVIIDAVGPETYTFNELLELMKSILHSRTLLIHLDPNLAQVMSKLPSIVLKDVILTREEVIGLMDNLLISHQPPTCPTKLSDWLKTNSDWLGKRYISELGKHYTK